MYVVVNGNSDNAVHLSTHASSSYNTSFPIDFTSIHSFTATLVYEISIVKFMVKSTRNTIQKNKSCRLTYKTVLQDSPAS